MPATTQHVTATPDAIEEPIIAPLSLRRNFSWTLLGNVVYAACQWGMLVVLAKLGSPKMVGQFALGLAVAAPVVIFANLALRPVQATDFRHEYLFGDYLALRLITTVLALLVILGITFVAGYRRETALVILAVGLAKAFESISDVFYGLLQQHEQMDCIAKSMMLKGPLSLVVLGIGVYITGNVLWGVLGLAAAWALTLVSYDMRNAATILNAAQAGLTATLWPRWKRETLKKLACLTLPLGFATMLGSLNTNIPRYFIERYLGEQDLGIFAAMAYLIVAGGMVVNALGQAASPRLAQYYAEGNDRAFCGLLLRLIGVGAVLGGMGVLLALLCGRELLVLIYRPEYASHMDVVVWLMIAAAGGYIASFLGYGMTAARLFRAQPFLFATTSVVAATGCFLLIPGYGLTGAAWAYGISLVVQLLGGAVLLYSLIAFRAG
jgi:O-antigen/teichoic acid export membrane protein